jgi:hypothetical protein
MAISVQDKVIASYTIYLSNAGSCFAQEWRMYLAYADNNYGQGMALGRFVQEIFCRKTISNINNTIIFKYSSCY